MSVVVALADVLFWLLVVAGVTILVVDVALWHARRAARRREREELRRLLREWREPASGRFGPTDDTPWEGC